MIVLGIDGALHGTFSTAVVRDGEVTAQHDRTGNVALERGLELVARSMRDAGVTAEAVGRIAVGTGPGGFTGLRIAIAYAKSLAQAWNVPLAGISSFDILEFGLELPRALAVVVGRPGVVSIRLRTYDATPQRLSGTIAEVVSSLAAFATPAEPLPIVGAPEDVLAAFAEGGFIVQPYPPTIRSAAVAAALAASSAQTSGSFHQVRPDYGERPAAKVPKRL
ncbi:MAG: tRNA (adenosine(37)-N6)-threonylcarbamoyltransferase complex dimerization subunit type 1 TsaB [Vulcanimicrobiaceae bacterium]